MAIQLYPPQRVEACPQIMAAHRKWLVSLTASLPGTLCYLGGPNSLCHQSSQGAWISPCPQTGLWPDLTAGAKLVFHSNIM